MGKICVLAFGACQVHGPMAAFAKARYEARPRLGVGGALSFTHTYAEIIQFIRFLRHEQTLPPEIKELCELRPGFEPWPGIGALGKIDLVLAEANAPTDIVFGPYSLQRNAIVHHILQPLMAANPGRQVVEMAHGWYGKGLLEPNDDAVQVGVELAKLVPADHPLAAVAREVLRHARGRKRAVIESLRELKAVIDKPVGVLTSIYKWMPNGRPVSWPIGFREETIAAAQAEGVPLFEPWKLVTGFGVSDALSSNEGHYSDEFALIIGDAIVGFAGEVVENAERGGAADRAVRSIA